MRLSRTLRNLSASALAAGLLIPIVTAVAPAAAATPETLLSTDFEDGTTGAWQKSGGPTLTVEDIDGSKALHVAGRANDFDGIQTPPGLFGDVAEGDVITLTMKARVADVAAGSTGVRFVMKPAYTWIGNAQMTSAAWTTVSGTFTVPAGADASALQAYIGTDALGAASSYGYLLDDITITVTPADTGTPPPAGGGDPSSLDTDFENGLDGWAARADAAGPATVAVSTAEFHGGTQAALVSGRTSQGQGLGHDVTGVLVEGATYEFSAWIKFAAGQPAGDVWLSLARTTGGSTSYSTLGQFDGMSNGQWVHVTQTFQMGPAETATIYLETAYNGSNTSDFFVDDISVSEPAPPQIEDLTPIKDTTDFPVGVAIDSRETSGAAAQLVTRHFDQVTSENFMKPEAWYNASKQFTPNPEGDMLMEFAQENDLKVYGHTLVWHSQTPAWFFQNDAGAALTTSAADQQVLKDRMRTHIFAVAKHLSDTYGKFGSSTNPLYAFDVVNEVVADGTEYADGLRRSEWYRILGENFIDLAFQYANEAFNSTYADASSTHPVTLFINDYNTEQAGKQARLHALVERLIARGVPVDGVGHQFHVSLSTSVTTLGAALTAFADLDLEQAVTELDVTTGTPVTQARLIEQGYYYRDAFRIFREHSDELFSVSLWGLTDGRSWRNSSGAPLAFNDSLKAKPAYFGIVDQALPARLRTANSFKGDVPLNASASDAIEWKQLPQQPIEQQATFSTRWESDHLTAYVNVTDTGKYAADTVQFSWADREGTFTRNGTGTGGVTGVVTEASGGYVVVVHLPIDTAAAGDTLAFDVRVVGAAPAVLGWNSPGVLGTLTLLESLSYLEVQETAKAPTIDGDVEAAWDKAGTVETGKQVQGSGSASATVRTLWKGNTLYVLADVTDSTVDVTGSDPWTQDSVEFFVDAGNVKNGSYRYDDTQIRISAANVASFGTGDETFQRNRITSAVSATATGYRVEIAISLLESGGANSFQGLDFQVNDATGGARTGIRNWADPTGAGYQSTARWGVGQLVPLKASEPTITPSVSKVVAGGTLDVALRGFEPGASITVVLQNPVVPGAFAPFAVATPVELATVTADASGAASASVTIPAGTEVDTYELAGLVDAVALAAAPLQVVAAAVGPGADPNSPIAGGAGGDEIARTGAEIAAWLALAAFLLVAGLVLVRARRRQADEAALPNA